jgi:peptidoglycan/LPS O-acetylase OafA/YrhL
MLASVGSARAIGPGIDYGYSWVMLALITPGEFFGVLFVIVFLLAAAWLYVQRDHLTRVLAFVVVATIFTGLILSNFTPLFPRYYITVSMIILLFAGCMILAIWEVLETQALRVNIPDAAIIIVILALIILLALQYGDFVKFYTVQKYLCA